MNKNIVFIACSIDGYIADVNGGIDWLNSIPNPENHDMGYNSLMSEVDAIVMGRVTFETVCSFDCEWPYNTHVFVLSNSLDEIPSTHADKASLLFGDIDGIIERIQEQGFNTLYIDGGSTIQNFLKNDLIHELRISTIPVLLGNGIPLFDILPKPLNFNHIKTEVFLGQIVQTHYKRKEQ